MTDQFIWNLLLQGEAYEFVKHYMYIRSCISSDVGVTDEVDARICKAQFALAIWNICGVKVAYPLTSRNRPAFGCRRVRVRWATLFQWSLSTGVCLTASLETLSTADFLTCILKCASMGVAVAKFPSSKLRFQEMWGVLLRIGGSKPSGVFALKGSQTMKFSLECKCRQDAAVLYSSSCPSNKWPNRAVSGARASKLSPSMRSYSISEQSEHTFASKASLYVPHSRFPVIETVAAGTNVPMVDDKMKAMRDAPGLQKEIQLLLLLSPRMVTKRLQANCQARRTDQQPIDSAQFDNGDQRHQLRYRDGNRAHVGERLSTVQRLRLDVRSGKFLRYRCVHLQRPSRSKLAGPDNLVAMKTGRQKEKFRLLELSAIV
ncbi:hypothetical protein CLF_100171 [Clonorchis sinensis]|uniref:Uncharacterized protein n=1 Tax=Clonorchis sinensis TaxID=79923 RepID=G7Y2U6_CLOSI|nr:hypothetical protein CLF_100171 [Clonorchis sinensis]